MASLPLCFVISISMLFHKCSILVQGKVIDVKTPLEKFHETVNDAGKQRKYSLKEQPNFLMEHHLDNSFYQFSSLFPLESMDNKITSLCSLATVKNRY